MTPLFSRSLHLSRVVLAFLVLIAALPATGFAQPDMRHVLERVRAQYPAVFAAAHRDYGQQGQPGRTTKAQAELFVRIAAAEMNRAHVGTEHAGKWGVNGKRGNRHDLSQDAVTYRLVPNRNQGFDVINGAGAPGASIAWLRYDETGTDATGLWIQACDVTHAEIDKVMSGGAPTYCTQAPPPQSGIDYNAAAATLHEAFVARTGRTWNPAEITAIIDIARQLGWNGGSRVPQLAVDTILDYIGRYSGDLANPFPAVTPDEALARINDKWRAQFSRELRDAELNGIVAYALTKWNGAGNVPVWLLNEILGDLDRFVLKLPPPIDPLSRPAVAGPKFTLDGEPFEWRGATAFMLTFDWFNAPAQYRAFRDDMVRHRVNVVRVSVATQTSYLTQRPKSGGTFGMGRTRALYPGDGVFTWDGYRAMLRDLLDHGIVAEVVPFLTAGPLNPTGACGGRVSGDRTVPQVLTAASRMAHMIEVATELLPIRAAFVEVANEYHQIGFCHDGREIVDLRLAYKAVDPDRLVAHSAYHPIVGDYATEHPQRPTSPRSWSWVIQQLGMWQLSTGLPVANNEGINADLVGEFGADATPANHFANGVLLRLVPNLSYTFHWDRALKGLPPSSIDGSLEAIQAWKAGYEAVPSVSGDYVALPRVLGADAAVARLGASEGWLLLIGATVAPAVPGWSAELTADVGPHRLYRLTRQ